MLFLFLWENIKMDLNESFSDWMVNDGIGGWFDSQMERTTVRSVCDFTTE